MLYRSELVRKGNYEKQSNSLHEYRQTQNLKKSMSLSEAQQIQKPEDIHPVKANVVNRQYEEHVKRSTDAKVSKELREGYLINSLYEVFFDGLPLDEEFKEDHKKPLKEVFAGEVAKLSNSAEDLLKEMTNSHSEFLQEMAESVKKQANEDSVKVAKGEVDKEDLEDKSIKNYDSKQASSLIKDKVMKVIKKENEISEREQKIEDEINQASSVNEGVEAFYQNKGAKQYRLFRAIMINSYKNAINKVTNLKEHSALLEETEDGLKMDTDKLLGESIIKYTILETFNTIGLKTYTPREVKALSNELAYKQFKNTK